MLFSGHWCFFADARFLHNGVHLKKSLSWNLDSFFNDSSPNGFSGDANAPGLPYGARQEHDRSQTLCRAVSMGSFLLPPASAPRVDEGGRRLYHIPEHSNSHSHHQTASKRHFNGSDDDDVFGDFTRTSAVKKHCAQMLEFQNKEGLRCYL